MIGNRTKHNSKSCLRCGTRNLSDAQFCIRCGEKLRGIKVTAKGEKKEERLRSSEPQRVDVMGEQRVTRFEVNKIYCGDCLQIMRQMPDEFVDLIVTSPPYNFGLDEYDSHRDTKTW